MDSVSGSPGSPVFRSKSQVMRWSPVVWIVVQRRKDVIKVPWKKTFPKARKNHLRGLFFLTLQNGVCFFLWVGWSGVEKFEQFLFWGDEMLIDTVDGQNPAPPIMMIIPLFIGF